VASDDDGTGTVPEDHLAALLSRAVAVAGASITLSDARRPDHPLVYVNRTFERITGYRREEVVGLNCRFLQTAATDAAALAEIRAALAEERPVAVTLLNRRRDGTTFWNDLSIAPVRDEAGALTHFVGVQRDVTTRVVAERRRDEHRAHEQEARGEAEVVARRLAHLAASADLDESLDVDVVAERLCHLVVPRLADACAVLLRGATGRSVIGRSAEGVDLTSADQHRLLRRLAGAAPGGRHRIVSSEGGTGGAAPLEALGFATALVLPLHARGVPLGTAVLLSARGRPGLPEAEVALAEELARRAAVALDNARRYRERDHIAAALQRALLPAALPEVPGCELAARYVPSGTGGEVGGDFYDIFETGDGWGIVIGDVCGKGPDAAAVTGLARHTVRVAAVQDRRPAAVLAVLNRVLLAEAGDDRFVTAAYADYAPTTDGARLRLALGGHPPPVLLRDGQVRHVGAHGSLLGVFDEVELADTVVDLRPGDTVVLVTDGVLEAPGVAGRLDLDGLLAAVVGTAGAEATAAAVVDAVTAHSGGPAPDDVAVLVLRVVPAP
jgi:PAS domain S-box-containing protein